MAKKSDKTQSETVVYGYARVSTEDQNLDLQRRALKDAGVEIIVEEKRSGYGVRRDQLEMLKKSLHPGDTLIVWKLDRLGRSVIDLIHLAKWLTDKGVEFRSLTEGLDTRTPMGRFHFTLLARLAQLERDITSERTKAGIAAAKARGVKFGQTTKIVGAKREAMLKDIWDLSMSMKQIARKHGYKSVTTLNKHFPGERSKAMVAAGIKPTPVGRKKP